MVWRSSSPPSRRAAREEGREAFASDADAIERNKAENADALRALETELEAGRITQDEFERKAKALVA